MIDLYPMNGTPFFTESEIKLRRYLETYFADGIRALLERENSAWRIIQIEAPILTQVDYLDSNYTGDDIWLHKNDMEFITWR